MVEKNRYISTGIPPRRKMATIIIERNKLIYDIKNYAYVEGDIMQTEDDHDRHQVQDICEDGNIDRVTRVLGLAYTECLETLYPYAKMPVHNDTARINHLNEWSDYNFYLLLPDDFSETTVSFLKEQINEYMVCRVLADWLSITKPSAAPNWENKAENAKTEIANALNHRVRRTRRTQTPF